MPWLVGTALIHSLAVTEKRGAFRVWTVLLAISAFALSLLGTFLVRSGVLTSVHAFATDPRRGIFILGFLVVAVGASLALFAWRAPRIAAGGRFALVSREAFLLANNAVLLAAAAAVMLGTLYPLVLDALGLGKISVGVPYFEAVFVPLMAPALLLMGVGPVARWKDAAVPALVARLRWAGLAALAAAVAIPLALGGWSAMKTLGLFFAGWTLASAVAALPRRLGTVTRAQLGMALAHAGVGVFVVGVTMVKGYEVERDLRMAPGQSATVGGYTFRLDGIRDVEGPNYAAARGAFSVLKDGKVVTTLFPEKRFYRVQEMPMTEAAIDSGLTRDLYVSLGESLGDGTWAVRIYHKPFVSWIWWGCLIMALGGLLAASDRRYRLAARREAPAGAAAVQP